MKSVDGSVASGLYFGEPMISNAADTPALFMYIGENDRYVDCYASEAIQKRARAYKAMGAMNCVKVVVMSGAFLAVVSAGVRAEEISLSCDITVQNPDGSKHQDHISPEITGNTYEFGGSVKEVGKDDLRISFSPTRVTVALVLSMGRGESFKEVVNINRVTGEYSSHNFCISGGEAKDCGSAFGLCAPKALNKKF